MFLKEKYSDDWESMLKDFIAYLETTTEESWCTDIVRTKNGRGNCLLGHLSNFCRHKDNDDVSGDFDWFENLITTTYVVYSVNDGTSDKYHQSTPKQRCIAYMKDLLSGKELTTWPGMAQCAARYNP